MKKILLSIFFASIFSISYSQDYVHTDVGTGNASSAGIVKITVYEPIANPIRITFTPNYAIVRSVTGSGGSSKTIQTDKGNFSISQSIGQSSVIGTHTKNNYAVLQGYQQRGLSTKTISNAGERLLKATVYPNPFDHSINILFDEIITGDILISVFDITGKVVVSTKRPGSKLVTLPLNIIANGIYILKVTAGKKQFTANMLKE